MTRSEKLSRLTDLIVFTMLGVIMFISKIFMEVLPNVHLLGMLTIVYTVVYRKRALIPIYVYVFLNGIYCGFAMWWIPYLYIWTILWGAVMLIPKKINSHPKIAVAVYDVICALHGLCFGILYAPAQALMFGLDFKGAVTWVIAGLPYDAVHAVGNLAAGLLIMPLVYSLKKFHKTTVKC